MASNWHLLNNLQEEFKALEEKATKVLEDYEKAQVSNKVIVRDKFAILSS